MGIGTAGAEAAPGVTVAVVTGEVMLAGPVPGAEAVVGGTGRAVGLTADESTHPEQIACPVGIPEHEKDPCWLMQMLMAAEDFPKDIVHVC